MLFKIEDATPLVLALGQIDGRHEELIIHGFRLGNNSAVRVNDETTSNQALIILNAALGYIDTPESILVASGLAGEPVVELGCLLLLFGGSVILWSPGRGVVAFNDKFRAL